MFLCIQNWRADLRRTTGCRHRNENAGILRLAAGPWNGIVGTNCSHRAYAAGGHGFTLQISFFRTALDQRGYLVALLSNQVSKEGLIGLVLRTISQTIEIAHSHAESDSRPASLFPLGLKRYPGCFLHFLKSFGLFFSCNKADAITSCLGMYG